MLRRTFVALMLVLAVQAVAPRPAEAGCGGPGEVPCYRWDWCAWRGLFGLCMGGLVANTPCAGCNCDRLNNWGLVCVSCGGSFQPACAFGPTCNGGGQRHTPFGLCWPCGQTGQATCVSGPQCDAGNRNVLGFCAFSGFSTEPTTNSTVAVPTQPEDEPLYGFADLHTHQFSNLGFGGVTFWGAPFDWHGINSALAWCDYTWDFSTQTHFSTPLPPVITLGYEVHGPNPFNAIGDPVELAIGFGAHPVGGTGPFDGWPKWNGVTHQQMYYKWVERAYQGGLRLMVMHAVNNEVLCRSGERRSGWGCGDMEAADRQLQAAKDLEWAIDWLDNQSIDGSGWYRIAYSPQQARQIIRGGKMAVVLGIEVDNLFRCRKNATCDETYLRGQVQKYYNMGVRHIFPVHGFDNGFGGAALFVNQYNKANRVVTDHYFNAFDCSSNGFGFNIGTDVLTDIFAFLLFGIIDGPPNYAGTADCNTRGLTATGATLVNLLMDQRMIVDVDHMSLRMLEGIDPDSEDGVLEIAERRAYPVVAGHAVMNDLNDLSERSEFGRTPTQLERIRNLGGIVAPGVPGRACGTSRKFPDIYNYAVSKMTGGLRWPGTDGVVGIGFSTDMNGFRQMTAPRFGADACGNDTEAALTYPFEAQDGSGLFHMQRTGDRTFDFNYDGMAHYGLIPDFLADVRKRPGESWGLTDEQLGPLFRSAEAYIRMWERIDRTGTGQSQQAVAPPTLNARVTGTLGSNGWYTSDVTVEWDIVSESDVVASIGCEDRTVTADTPGLVITCEAANESGGESAASVTIKRDTQPPAIQTARRETAPNVDGWNNGDVEVLFEATDATSGLAGAGSVKIAVSGEGSNLSAEHRFTDQAGLTTVATLGDVMIDRTPPRVGFRFTHLSDDASLEQIQAEQMRWQNQNVVLNVEAEDDLSGVASVTPAQIVLSAEGTNVRGGATATDKAGNSITVESEPMKIDKTAPTIELVSRTPANAAGWNKTSVTTTWACGDTLSGVTEPLVNHTLADEGANQSARGTCQDLAGNTTSHTEEPINIDVTPPTVTFDDRQPGANGYGWHRTDVAWPFTSDDNLSGVASTSAGSPLIVGGEGVNLTRTVDVIDKAGNSASFTTPAVQIDRTPPAIALVSRLPGANAHGWNNSDVTATWRCSDLLAGVVQETVSETLASEGAGRSLTGRCVDRADNETTDTVAVNLDKTPPTVLCDAGPASLWPPDHRLVPVAVTLTFTDALSGPATFALTTATSSEPDNGVGDGDTSNDIQGFVVGGNALTGSMRAERAGPGVGRVYGLGYRGLDAAGNAGICGTTVIVPHDLGGEGERPPMK